MKKILWTVIALASVLTVTPAEAQTVEFYTPKSVRIVRDGGKSDIEKQSLSIIASPEKVKVSTLQQEGATLYRSSALTVRVEDGKVSFLSPEGVLLMQEGEHSFSPITEGPDQGSFRVKQGFIVEPDEAIYGLGLLQNGKMSQRGEKRLMMQSNLDDYAHFYQSIKGYGLFWDNYSPTEISVPQEGQQGELILESQVGDLEDYYFLYGGNADGVIREMRHLSGKVPMLALWTYGFHQSRERYKSEKELLDVLHTYRKLGVPIDGMIQDWQYWGSNYNWNAMEFLNPEFDHAQQMIDEVHNQHAHLHISIWASFGPETKAYRQLDKEGLLFHFFTWPQSGLPQWPPRKDYLSGVKCYNPYSKRAREIYWQNLSRLHQMGIDSWWMDSTDPDHLDYQESDLDELCTFTQPDGTEKRVSYRSVRNAFPLMTVQGVHDSQKAVDRSKRLFILTRSYFAGQQRYGANTWSGDIGSSWDSFRKQIPICLNYTLTANPNVNTDIGGFFANAYNKHSQDNTATKNPLYQELYVRWMQFGAFCPLMRSHGTEVYREIYHYGQPGEPVYDALLAAIKLRYSLLPYIYSTSWQVSRNDDSFMRALMMDFREDRNTWNNNREYMFGHAFLVAPVVTALYTPETANPTNEISGWDRNKRSLYQEGFTADWNAAKTYSVYLPAGARWYDFWTNELLEGGQTIEADATLAHSPLYVRAGSIIPACPQDQQYADMKNWSSLEIRVYPGANASFTLYEDEGDNYNYENGAYSTIDLRWNDRSRTLTIGKRQGSFDGMLDERTFTITLPDGTNKTIAYKGKAMSVKF